jgi:hypothetical protein
MSFFNAKGGNIGRWTAAVSNAIGFRDEKSGGVDRLIAWRKWHWRKATSRGQPRCWNRP